MHGLTANLQHRNWQRRQIHRCSAGIITATHFASYIMQHVAQRSRCSEGTSLTSSQAMAPAPGCNEVSPYQARQMMQ